MSEPITVLKLNLAGEVTWSYTGVVLRCDEHQVVLEARFNRPDTPFYEIMLKQNDRIIETFYADRWYNIFEIHDRDDDQIKGWYCNLGRPAQLKPGVISYVDLAIDLLVYPDGRQVVLDEDEYALLPLEPADQVQVYAALGELQQKMKNIIGIHDP